MDSGTDEPETTELLRDLQRLAEVPCLDCSHRLCGHEALCSIALGFKKAPRCLSCLARGLSRPVNELRDQLTEYLLHRPCYSRAWNVASTREARDGQQPFCPWLGAVVQTVQTAEVVPAVTTNRETATATWDAGDMSCGDLVLALRQRLQTMTAGNVLKVIARDPAAPEDLPAWCRLTGNKLLAATHPEYLIQRRGG